LCAVSSSGEVDPGELAASQLAAMDPDLDDNYDGVDIAYLMKVVANKYRFLASFASAPLPFTIATRVLDASSAPATAAGTQVRYEVGTTENSAAIIRYAVGSDLADTDDGVVVTAEMTVDGYFNATVILGPAFSPPPPPPFAVACPAGL
jgi:hypothetical protein